MISEEKLLRKSKVKRRNKWIRHIMRRKRLLKLIIEGSVERNNHRGKPIIKCIQQLIKN